MAKRYKKETKMIDMSARLQVEVVPATEEEIEQINKEFEELFLSIERKNRLYVEQLTKAITDKLFMECAVFEEEDNSYTMILSDRVINVKQKNNNLFIESNNDDKLEEVVRHYFDLDRDYDEMKNKIIKSQITL